MPIYSFKARTLDGKIIKGEIDAYDKNDLVIILRREGKILISAKKRAVKTPNMLFRVSSKPKRADVVLFIRQLSIMVSAGIAVEDAVDTINQQTSSSALKKILIEVEEELYKGALLSQALAKYPKVFPAYFRNMIYVGEVSGQLSAVLNKVADFYERDGKIRRKASTAVIYPIFLFCMILGIFIFLVTFIVPRFQANLMSMNADLPKITKIVLAISDFFKVWWPFVVGGIIIFAGLLWLWFKTKSGRYFKDYMKLNFPIIKRITYYTITTRFSKGLSVLVSSGLNVMESIDIIGKLMDNVIFETKFQYVIDEIKKGKRIHKSIEHISFFPKMLIEMINVGESTGSLDEVLDITSDYYDEVLEQTIQKGTQLLEPILIVFSGFLVGFVVLSILLPMISMIRSIR